MMNMAKTKIISNMDQGKFELDGKELESVSECCDLGKTVAFNE